MAERLMYGIPAAAEQLSIGERAMAELLRKGVVESVKVGRRRLVPHDALEAYIERLKAAS